MIMAKARMFLGETEIQDIDSCELGMGEKGTVEFNGVYDPVGVYDPPVEVERTATITTPDGETRECKVVIGFDDDGLCCWICNDEDRQWVKDRMTKSCDCAVKANKGDKNGNR